MIKKNVYLDNAACTALDPQVKEIMDRYSTEEFGNSSSINRTGRKAKRAIEGAREKVSIIMNCKPEEIIFTSGGTESINLAIQGLAKAYNSGHIITTKVEHKSVLNTCEYLQTQGFTVTYLDVDNYGMVSIKDILDAIVEDTFLVSIIFANNEIGSINLIQEIGTMLKDYPNIHFHTDACQAGALNLNVKELGVDMLSLNGSKIYGPRGSGLLYLKNNVPLRPLFYGGDQEHRLRSGSENLPAIMGFAAALSMAQKENKDRMITMRDRVIREIIALIPNARLNGHAQNRLANNVNVTIDRVEGEILVQHLSQLGIHAGTGSACASQNIEPSHVLKAIGLSDERAVCSIRFTLGKDTVEADIDYLLDKLPPTTEALRKISQETIEVLK